MLGKQGWLESVQDWTDRKNYLHWRNFSFTSHQGGIYFFQQTRFTDSLGTVSNMQAYAKIVWNRLWFTSRMVKIMKFWPFQNIFMTDTCTCAFKIWHWIRLLSHLMQKISYLVFVNFNVDFCNKYAYLWCVAKLFSQLCLSRDRWRHQYMTKCFCWWCHPFLLITTEEIEKLEWVMLNRSYYSLLRGQR